MSTELPTIKLAVTDLEINRCGIDPKLYMRSLARRKALEAKQNVGMVEYYHDVDAMMHRVVVYFKAKDANRFT